MEIRELRAFVTVVDEGGVSAAARKLHVSQSALSQTVQTLERQLGGKLLTRDHTGARPTELGQSLLTEARLMVEQHDRLLASLTAPVVASSGPLRVGVPLELPADLLPGAIAEVTAAHPDVHVHLQHAASSAQVAMLKAGDLEAGLVRDRPSDPFLDSVLAVEEAMGVILTAERAAQVSEPSGVPLHRLAGLTWAKFARSDAPAWHDQVLATLHTHGVTGTNPAIGENDRPVPPEVKLAAVGTGRTFAFASPGWARPLPHGLTWHPLIGNPIVRRTWAVWPADSRQREVAALVAALDMTRLPSARRVTPRLGGIPVSAAGGRPTKLRRRTGSSSSCPSWEPATLRKSEIQAGSGARPVSRTRTAWPSGARPSAIRASTGRPRPSAIRSNKAKIGADQLVQFRTASRSSWS